MLLQSTLLRPDIDGLLSIGLPIHRFIRSVSKGRLASINADSFSEEFMASTVMLLLLEDKI